MHDGITIARRGLAAGVICTKPFLPTGRAMARALGEPDYPFAMVDHPIGSLTPEQLRERAADAVQQLLPLLLGTPAAVAS